MLWQEIRHQYPQQWLLVEALEAHSDHGIRVLDQLAVINSFPDSVTAMRAYRQHHHLSPNRELYVLHTSREDLEIGERHWVGIRGVS